MPVLLCFLSLKDVWLWALICFNHSDILLNMMLLNVSEQETQSIWVLIWLLSQYFVNILEIMGVLLEKKEVLSWFCGL